MGKQKDKGTRRETAVVRHLQEHLLDANRAPNNLPSKDVELRVRDLKFAIEVKDRQNLNLHQTLGEAMGRWSGEIPAVVWHRTKKDKDAKRSTPVGPTLIALRLEDFAYLMTRIEDDMRRDA